MIRKRFSSAVILAMLIILTTAVTALGKEIGRYQAMEIRVGKKSEYTIFILDTKDGHMWLLETEESRVDGTLSGGLKYHGKLRPGKKVGEMIFEFGKTK
jgi:ligand-binding sensor domain-containing protein